MAEIKLTWSEFLEAAIFRLAEQHPKIALNKENNARFVRDHSYEGEGECYELPQYVYVRLEP
ncbi:hypothetical protein LCGC14_1239390 [marine sediment metagenome]|uniref:Uncharacterized protein n=1 Tax=marine sediment metagenome TaxID=412755 RepID=A0A0F9LAF2_9ZZZZ